MAAATYGRDNAGQLSSTTPSGSWPGTAQTYTYTPQQQVSTDSSSSYAYDPADNPTSLATSTQAFDPAGQLCWTGSATGGAACNSPPSGATTYTFNTNGQRTATTPASGTASTFSYNQAGELTSATTPAGSGTYTYDGTGLRVSKNVAGTTTPFTWGNLNGQNLVLHDGTTDYIYGPGGLPVEFVWPTLVRYYVHDQLGSTVAYTNDTGAVSGTVTYNTYGQATAHTGTNTPPQYAGGYLDAETGLLYLQNRYYDPVTAQFLTIDPAIALTGQPYTYVDDNPLNLVDPDGQMPDEPFNPDAGGYGGDSGADILSSISQAEQLAEEGENAGGSQVRGSGDGGSSNSTAPNIGTTSCSRDTNESALNSLGSTVRTDINDAIQRAKSGKVRFPGHDGKVYNNSDGLLPRGGSYTEWTAAGSGSKRGADRVIIDGDPADPTAIYYWDHVYPPIRIGP